MATNSSVLAWRIPGAGKPGGLPSMGSQSRTRLKWFSSSSRRSIYGFPDSSVGKEFACSAGDPGSIPGLERSPGEEKGYPLQYSDLENSMDCIDHNAPQDYLYFLLWKYSIIFSLVMTLTKVYCFCFNYNMYVYIYTFRRFNSKKLIGTK